MVQRYFGSKEIKQNGKTYRYTVSRTGEDGVRETIKVYDGINNSLEIVYDPKSKTVEEVSIFYTDTEYPTNPQGQSMTIQKDGSVFAGDNGRIEVNEKDLEGILRIAENKLLRMREEIWIVRRMDLPDAYAVMDYIKGF